MYLSEHQRERLMHFEPSEQPDVHLLSSLDGLFLLRRNAASLIEGADGTHRLLQHHANGLTDLRYHAIVDRGRIVGFWEYDVGEGCIVWATFQKPDPAVVDAVAATETYVRTELGDARAFSLDSPKRRAPRIAALRHCRP